MKTEEVEAKVGSIYRATALDFEGYKAVKEFIDVNVVEDMGDIVIEYEKVLVESFELEPKELELASVKQSTEKGYQSENGGIRTQINGEHTTTQFLELADVEQIEIGYFNKVSQTKDAKLGWACVGYYDQEKKFLERPAYDVQLEIPDETLIHTVISPKRTSAKYIRVSARWQEAPESYIRVKTKSNSEKVTVTPKPANAKDKSFTLDHTEAIETSKLSDTEFLVWKNDDTEQVLNVVANDGGKAKAVLPVKHKADLKVDLRARRINE